METREISELMYYHKTDQWWNGRTAVVTSQIKNMHDQLLKKDSRVTIHKRRSCKNDAGVVLKESFLVEKENSNEIFSVPRELLRLEKE